MVVLLVDNPTFTDNLVSEIIEIATASGIELSATDVTDIAIFTLHSIVTANSGIEADATKKGICEMIGNDSKIGEYLFTTLGGISTANDEWIDKQFMEKGVVTNGGC